MTTLILFTLLFGLSCQAREVRKFIQVTDFHYDSSYKTSTAEDDKLGMRAVAQSCHDSSIKNPGKYGNFDCDSPAALVRSVVIDGMAKIVPKPEFIVWTGDSTPHIPNEAYNNSRVIDALTVVTKLLKETFPNTTTYAVLGNHDYSPSDQLPTAKNDVYEAAEELWTDWLKDGDVHNTLAHYGYYSIEHKDKHWIACLNTNLYYQFNKEIFPNPEDPAGQFRWLENLLQKAKAESAKVHIIAHIPPGGFERTANMTWFKPEYNKRFLQVLANFSDTLGFMLFGHDHTDTFRMARLDEGQSFGVMLLAPAVTPWRSTLPGAGANNPSFRVFSIDKDTFEIMDIEQYYLDLEAANRNGTAEWKLEYSFAEAYSKMTAPFTAYGFDALHDNFMTDDSVFQKYFKFNSVSKDTDECKDECRKVQLCTIAYPDLNAYYRCLENGPSMTVPTTTPSNAIQPLTNICLVYVTVLLLGVIQSL